MEINGKQTVEYIEHNGNDYQRTSDGQWYIQIGESIEPVVNPEAVEVLEAAYQELKQPSE